MPRSKSESGRLGGLATLANHGREWFRALGKKGIQATADRYFQGSVPDAMSWLRLRAAEKQIGGLASLELDRKLAEGAEVASMELPVLLEPGDDPLFRGWVERVAESRNSRRQR